MRTPEGFYKHVAALGFYPKTVIDVGVNYGTPEIYSVFPEAFYHFIEPLAELEERLKALVRRYRGTYHLVAAGKQRENLPLFVPTNHDGATLIFGAVSDHTQVREVEVRPLDEIIDPEATEGPVLLKTDCQGADMDVIEGATKTLEQCDLVVLEVQMFRAAGFYANNEFTNVITSMAQRGFVAYDFVGYYPRPADGALGHTNVAFVKENGFFRKSHRWR